MIRTHSLLRDITGKRQFKVVILREGQPSFEMTTTTTRGAGGLLAFLHSLVPDAEFVTVEAV